MIDPNTNTVATTINLTSFDEDPRPPFRLVTGGVTPTHAAMVTKPLYHGAINIHGAAPSPDNKLLACTGRGTSNVYLIDLETMKVIGNTPNPQAGDKTNAERLTSGVLVGREPHEPTFSRNGKEIWVTIRGESRIAILDTAAALKESRGDAPCAVRQYLDCLNGPAQVWFSADGKLAFIISQKTSQLEVVETNFDATASAGRNGARCSTSKPRTRSASRHSRKLQRMAENFGFRTSWRIPFRRGRSIPSHGARYRAARQVGAAQSCRVRGE